MTDLTVRTVSPRDLTSQERQAWRALHRREPLLASPFLAPEFVDIVGAVRTETEVGVLTRAQQAVGFFPFHRGRFGVGHPVGAGISDYQAVVAGSDVEWDGLDLVRRCGLNAWEFDHLLRAQTQFATFHERARRSPVIHLGGGYSAYIRSKQQQASWPARVHRHRRKLAREHGEINFVMHTTDAQVLRTLLDWKSAQYQRTGMADVLRRPWVRDVLAESAAARSPGFAGVLSALYAGDRLVSAHLGLRSDTTWHSWFPAYDIAFARYSPGLILFLEMAEAAPTHGIDLIDLGKGDNDYKLHLMTSAIEVAEGMVSARGVAARSMRARRAAVRRGRRLQVAPRIRRALSSR